VTFVSFSGSKKYIRFDCGLIFARSFDISIIATMETILPTTTNKNSATFSAYNIVWFIAHLFIALFFYTALAKLINPPVFYGTLNDVPMVKPFASFLTYAIPAIELFISLLLLFNRTRKIGLIAGGSLMLLFTVYIGLMLFLYGKEKLPCSCGGFVSQLSWTAHIYFNLAFVGLSIWALSLLKRLNKR
jgi:methylamine utilization protein MauE